MKRYLVPNNSHEGAQTIIRVVERDAVGITVIVDVYGGPGTKRVERERFYPWTSVAYIETRGGE